MKKEMKNVSGRDTTSGAKEKYSADKLRRSFLDYFEARGHRIVPSSSLIPEDPTLLFTAAGMVQFKAYYSDPGSVPFTRAASVQKCLRAGGKQSDLENVGRTLRHHTFFEMLGNFSFGDYFKKEAIDYAWELVVDVWGMERERLWVSVFEKDQEAFDLWALRIGLPEERIVLLGKKDNFWGPVGDTGVCGPSSEIYYDTGEDRGCGQEDCGPGCDCERYVEFWNLVFPQFFLTRDGEYDPLPKPGIDTGLGLERLAFILQGVEDNFHTDLFLPVRRAIDRSLPRGADREKASMAINVAADHLRALCFAMAAGIIPSNEGRGYILRRLLRRSLTKMHPFGVRKPFLSRAVNSVVGVMGKTYQELKERERFIEKVIAAEEERFLSTLEEGLERLGKIIDRCQSKGEREISGKEAFVLYDTFGFPPELTRELSVAAGLEVDMQGFSEEMREQKEKARTASFHLSGRKPGEGAFIELKKVPRTSFLGYERLVCEACPVAFRPVEAGGNEDYSGLLVELITDRTVFYAESGGQVGDKGTIRCGKREMKIIDTYYLGDRIVHLIRWGNRSRMGGSAGRIREFLAENRKCFLSVDPEARRATARNHTATHLLHAALKEVLGDHVVQAGSLVEPLRLRFDFHHYGAMSGGEIASVEEVVNRRILDDSEVRISEVPYERALGEGAVALFGEKYGEVVRVVMVENFSKELCGGTHVGKTGEIGVFLVRQEGAVSSGVRRIEAVTGLGALDHVRRVVEKGNAVASLLKVSPGDVERKVRGLLDEVESLRKKLSEKDREVALERIESAIASSEEAGGARVVSLRMDTDDLASLRHAGDVIRERASGAVGLVCSALLKKPILIVVVSEDLIREKGLKANALVAMAASKLKLRGGGKAHLAQMGLEDESDFERVEALVREHLEGLY